MQRTGRKGHAQFRIVVQDSRRHPSSGRFVAQLGHYDPHSKNVVLEKDKASQYLQNGAQPSDRVAKLFQTEGIDLPAWVKITSAKKRSTRNPEKLRKNQPKEEAPAEAEATEATETTEEEQPAEA